MTCSIEGSVSIGWLHKELGFRADEPYYLDPAVHHERFLAMQDYCAARFPDCEINFFEANLVQTAAWRRDQLMVGPLQPSLIQGAALGARLRMPGDKDPDIEPAPLGDLDREGLRRLAGFEWEKAWPVRLFLDQIDRLKAEHGEARPVVPPFYWDASGRATIHGPVTTAQKLMGERIFLEMMQNEPFALAFLDWITEGTIALCRLFARRAGLPITGVHIGECSACMLGPAQFERFSRPFCQRIIDALGPGRIHSCGRSDRLLESFAGLRNLRCVNTGSRTSVRKIREVFGPALPVEIAPPAQDLASGTPDDARRFVDRTLEENGDGPLLFVYHLDAGCPERNGRALHDRLIDRGLIPRGRRHIPPGGAA